MIDLLVFLPACFALNLAFGPNNLVAMTHGAQKGVGFSFMASTARLAVFVPMIAASALGLGMLLSASALVFNVIKIVGAAYLVWMGIKLLRTTSGSTTFAVTCAVICPGRSERRPVSSAASMTDPACRT